MKGRLKRLILGVLILALAVVAAAGFLLGSETGARWLLRTASRFVPGQLTVEHLEGSVLGGFRLRGLAVETTDWHLRVEDLRMRWSPVEILRGGVQVDELRLESVSVERTGGDAEDKPPPRASGSFHLPELALPMGVRLEGLEVSTVEWIAAPEATPVRLDRLSAAAEWGREGIHLRSVRASAFNWTIGLSGTIQPKGSYPLALETTVVGALEAGLSVEARGKVSGTMDRLTVAQSLTGDVMAALDGTIVAPLEGLEWAMTLEVAEASPSLIPSWLPRDLWIRCEGRGDLRRASDVTIQAGAQEARLEGSADIAWAPVATWTAEATGVDLNPAYLHPDWPGRLGVSLVSTGEWAAGALRLGVDVGRLSGTVRDRPVAGGGRLALSPDGMGADGAFLSVGRSRIDLDGRVDGRWRVDWRADISDLADLLPDASGRMHGEGTVRGTRSAPLAAGSFLANDVGYGAFACQQAQVDFSAGPDPSQPFEVAASAHAVSSFGQFFPALAVRLAGTLTEHRLDLAVTHEAAALEATAAGGYAPDERSWEGAVAHLLLDAGEGGRWLLEAPGRLCLSPDQQQATGLCLVHGAARACVELDRRPAGGSADLSIRGASLEAAQSLLPATITALDGRVHLSAHADLGPRPAASMEVVIDPGSVEYLAGAARPERLPHRNGRVAAELDDRTLSLDGRWELGPHRLSAQASMPREGLESDARRAPMHGEARLVFTDLDLLTAVFPVIQTADGSMDAHLTMAGSIADPEISGYANLDAERVEIPRAGLVLTDIRLEAGGGGEEVELNGTLRSGRGTLAVVGNVRLDPAQGWPTALVLTGERVQLVNLPDVEAVVSPHLTWVRDRERTTLAGYVLIPEGRLALKDAQGGTVAPSPDEIIVGEEEEALPASWLDAEITVELGNNVRFRGFGLQARLGGRVTVNQAAHRIPTANGELIIRSGRYRAFGQELAITQGRLSFAGGPLTDPGIRLRAGRDIDGVVVGVDLSGTASQPVLRTFSSDPAIREGDRMIMLLTGQPAGNIANARFYRGRQIAPNLSVGVNLSAGDEGSELVTRYRLWNRINIEGTSSSTRSGVNLSVSWDVP